MFYDKYAYIRYILRFMFLRCCDSGKFSLGGIALTDEFIAPLFKSRVDYFCEEMEKHYKKIAEEEFKDLRPDIKLLDEDPEAFKEKNKIFLGKVYMRKEELLDNLTEEDVLKFKDYMESNEFCKFLKSYFYEVKEDEKGSARCIKLKPDYNELFIQSTVLYDYLCYKKEYKDITPLRAIMTAYYYINVAIRRVDEILDIKDCRFIPEGRTFDEHLKFVASKTFELMEEHRLLCGYFLIVYRYDAYHELQKYSKEHNYVDPNMNALKYLESLYDDIEKAKTLEEVAKILDVEHIIEIPKEK